jgi:hypothetical protein
LKLFAQGWYFGFVKARRSHDHKFAQMIRAYQKFRRQFSKHLINLGEEGFQPVGYVYCVDVAEMSQGGRTVFDECLGCLLETRRAAAHDTNVSSGGYPCHKGV